jgi:hypothetical protein
MLNSRSSKLSAEAPKRVRGRKGNQSEDKFISDNETETRERDKFARPV